LNHARLFRNVSLKCGKIIAGKADAICFQFLSRLPEVRENLASDVSAAYDGDPAAYSLEEILGNTNASIVAIPEGVSVIVG
jgi:serine O-acetyltransferase